MTDRQIKVFRELLKDESFKGKKKLEHLLWLNTSKPQYKIGDCYKFTREDTQILGKRIINFNGKIDGVNTMLNTNEYYYRMTVSVSVGDKTYKTNVCGIPESEMGIKTDTYENHFKE